MERRRLLIFLMLIVAVFFRFNNLNWDQNFHLHPDERFLTMVGNATKAPKNILDYFNPVKSTLNPANVGYPFFVYGALPLTLNKIAAIILSNDTYNDFTLQGRFLSGLVDLFVLILIFKTVLFFEKKYKIDSSLKYWASFFYAIAVLPVQLSHFFAVDSFLNLFMFASFYFALRKNIFFSALFFGLAAATKVTALAVLPLNLVILGLTDRIRPIGLIRLIGAYLLIAYFALRIGDPYLFQTSNFLDLRISESFMNNLKTLKSLEGANIWYPPAVQWIKKVPVIFSLTNLAVFGVGIPYFIFIVLGIINLLRSKLHVLRLTFYVIIFWMLAFFLYQSTQFVKAMRYFIFLYPFFAIFAAFGIFWIIDSSVKKLSRVNSLFLVLILLIWPIMFSTIYFRKSTRVEASEWIYKNIPDRNFIVGEHWDDPLPLIMDSQKRFTIELLPVFDPDTDKKWERINSLLKKSDYYILSSNRGWGSIMTVPEKYPRMSKFYNQLLANKTEFKKIKEFHSYPSLEIGNWKLEIGDDFADESFTVYDHPKVLIFQKQ